MRKIILMFVVVLTASCFAQGIELPKVEIVKETDIFKALETRAATRGFSDKEISDSDLSLLLWAGMGIVQDNNQKTIHGYDAVSSATPVYKHAVQWGWGSPYLKLYVLLGKGVFEYIPEKHLLKFISGKNMLKAIGSNASNPQTVIVIATDFNKMSKGERPITNNVAFMTAGSVAQNIQLFASLKNLKMMTEVYFRKSELKETLKLPETIKPLTILSLGY